MADLNDSLGSLKDPPVRPRRVTRPVRTVPTEQGPPVPVRRPVYNEYLGIKPDLQHLRFSSADIKAHVAAWETARAEMKAALEELDKMECWTKLGELPPIIYPEIWEEHKTTIEWMTNRAAGGYAVAIATHDVLKAIDREFLLAIEKVEADAKKLGPK